MNNKISIITPVYNHQEYIERCITSVLSQTYVNWELIIVDDKSTDNTREIIKKYAKRDRRIVPIFHKKNWGIKKLVYTYNEALKQADGSHVCILEGDDYWQTDKLKNQLFSTIQKKNIALSFGDWVLTDREGRGLLLRAYPEFSSNGARSISGQKIRRCFQMSNLDIDSSTVMICKKNLEEIGGFQQGDKNYPFTDLPTYFELTKTGDFLYIPKILGHYRRHSSSSWLAFALKSETMGREEISNLFQEKMGGETNNSRWGGNNKSYLNKRRSTKQISVFLNKVACNPSKNVLYYFAHKLMRLFFFIQLVKYRVIHF